MKIGAFSISLPVADLAASQAFYATLGFEQSGGNPEENWVIMRNGETVIGLFHGMFTAPILTFNPGIDQHMNPVDDFTDVRTIQTTLQAAGTELMVTTDPEATGPAHIVLADPDGHQIMIDQFALPSDPTPENAEPPS